jgi:hypothetical protein
VAGDAALLGRLRGINAQQIRDAHQGLGGAVTHAAGTGSHRSYTRSELIAALDLIATQQGGRRG